MPTFAYIARDRAGKTASGNIDAASRKDVLRILTARGLQPTQIDERSGSKPIPGATAKASAAERKARKKDLVSKLSRRERLPFFQALHDLTSSGLSAGESVRLLALRLQDPMLRALCTSLWERLSEGASLSQAMNDFPAVFDQSGVNLIQSGEATGNINDVLDRVITHLSDQQALRRDIMTKLSYPIFMMFVSAGVIIFIITFLMPRLESLLQSLGGKLPLSTQILVGFSGFAMHYGLIFIGVGIFGGVSFWRWRATKAGREKTDAALLRLPLIGPFLVSQTVLSFSQTLSVLLENGITTVEALRMTERQITNTNHRKSFKQATERVMEGEALSRALQRTGWLPPLVLDQLSVGENTGNLVPSLKKISVAYQKSIAALVSTYTSVITNTILLTVFAFVGFIAFAVVSAVFQLSNSIKMH